MSETGEVDAAPAHLQLGELGEGIACKLLRRLGLDVLARNYTGPNGEIDIVGRDGAVLCFVEVKTRHRSSRSRPADAVTGEKKKRLVRTAQRYIRQLGHPAVLYRYDIVEIVFDENDVLVDARYWPNDFTEADVKRRKKEHNPPFEE